MSALRDSLKSVSEYSVALYRAMLANARGFFEHCKDSAAAVEALAEACKKLKVEIQVNDGKTGINRFNRKAVDRNLHNSPLGEVNSCK